MCEAAPSPGMITDIKKEKTGSLGICVFHFVCTELAM